MKKDLLELIEKTSEMRRKFHFRLDARCNSTEIIYNDSSFIEWNENLQGELVLLLEQKDSPYISSTLHFLQTRFDGSKDVTDFHELTGKLKTIKQNIDALYPEVVPATVGFNSLKNTSKPPKLFISHSSKDVKFITQIVQLLEDIGITQSHLFCSSVPGYGIALGKDIYTALLEEFDNYSLHIIFVLSENYYSSPACLNEMGAAWVMHTDYTTILLPGFGYSQINGAINKMQIAIKFDDNDADFRNRLTEFKDMIVRDFSLPPIADNRWERLVNRFISNVDTINSDSQTLNSKSTNGV